MRLAFHLLDAIHAAAVRADDAAGPALALQVLAGGFGVGEDGISELRRF